ncbi:VanZ family protein [Streptomyces dubilierae]|uniref:VanZ family protein n=1 Tax=Streptomyces dubilierae TaxID=3075533 RepID=A0ABU2P9F1_9ACTN|nr:VanZ family protein [Streptomyces sp. DSM 41921]MDT0388783.1 VanZ family protein [Streptomyces sp. DSM 41921]
MKSDAPRSAALRRTRQVVVPVLAILGVAGVAFVLRRPLLMPAPACMAGRWHGCFDTFNGVLLMTLVALPLSAPVVWALARRRRAAGAALPWRTSLAEVGLVHGTVPFLWMTMMPGGADPGTVPARVSLVPLRDLVTMGPLGIAGNLLIFAALGFFAPMRWAALASVPRILALGAVCSALVESAQYVLRLDRVSSVDDVLVNATGAALAALASRRWWRRPGPGAEEAQAVIGRSSRACSRSSSQIHRRWWGGTSW